MTITIKKVTTKKELKKFIRFNYELYKDNPYSVPDLYDDSTRIPVGHGGLILLRS